MKSGGEAAMKRNEFLKETKERLVYRRDALRRALAGDMSMLRSQHEDAVGDEIDAAIATEQSEIRSQMASFESRELAQIENALEKIRHGLYGRCETCDKVIAPVRLKALPYATECIACARRDESHAAGGGRHLPVNRIAAFSDADEGDTSANEVYEEIR
jgi:DnaK suppressor protein